MINNVLELTVIYRPVVTRTPCPDLMASLDALNERFGRGTVRVATEVPAPGHLPPTGTSNRPPWEGKAQWRSPAFTIRLTARVQKLEKLLTAHQQQ